MESSTSENPDKVVQFTGLNFFMLGSHLRLDQWRDDPVLYHLKIVLNVCLDLIQ